MPSVNPGPAINGLPNTVAGFTPVNTQTNSTPVGTNALRLLAVARSVNLGTTGDTIMPIINASAWAPATVVVANGQVSGVQGSIATASIGIFTAANSGGTALKTQAALASNTAAGSSIVAASAVVNLAYTGQNVYVNCGTALANATCDVFLYGYDQS